MSAKAMNMRKTVQTLQNKLSCAAKKSLDRRFGALYDKIYREDVLQMAWQIVKANQGCPGIDGESLDLIEERIGKENFLQDIAEKLRSKTYRPKPVLRRWREKPGTKKKRPLGIPIIKDRVVQTATRIVIEPIFETNFLDGSYGYRPERNQHQAIQVIRGEIHYQKRYEVIDADIKGYFDNIDKGILMNLVQRRISDPRVLKLIKGWLKAGVMNQGKYEKSGEKGTSQGSSISPLLSNIYLHSFDKMWEQSGIPGKMVRFADDFVILLRGSGKRVLGKVQSMLKRLKLELHPQKTRIVSTREGFDFLGVHFCTKPVKKQNSRMKYYCWTWPSDRSMKRIKQNIRETIGRRYSISLEEMIKELNPKLRGWRNYHKLEKARKRIRKLNMFVRERLRIFLKRKYSDASRGGRRLYGAILPRLVLYQMT